MRNYNNPLVSVIMNCHNGEQYLRSSINSILKQDYKNWELIFWDNKSNDRSHKILKYYKDKRIRYFRSNVLTSLYKARNLAISKAKGHYLCFLDVDDWWVKSKISSQIKVLKKNKDINFIYSNFYYYYENKKKKKIFSKNLLPEGKITQDLLNYYKIGILTVMIKKKLFKKNKFNYNFKIIGDFDYFINLSIKEKFLCVQKPLAYYRVHKNNFSNNFKIHSDEVNKWLNQNSNKFLKKRYSLTKLYLLNIKLKIKKFLSLGP